MIRLVVGLSVGIVVGTVIGFAMAGSAVVQRSVGRLMTGLQALPSIAWLPLAIVWFGLSEKAVMFVVFIAAIPAMAIATASSIRLVPPLLVRAGRTMGAKELDAPATVVLHAASPATRRAPVGVGARVASADGRRADLDGRQGPRPPPRREPPVYLVSRIIAVMLMVVIVGMLVDSLFR